MYFYISTYIQVIDIVKGKGIFHTPSTPIKYELINEKRLLFPE